MSEKTEDKTKSVKSSKPKDAKKQAADKKLKQIKQKLAKQEQANADLKDRLLRTAAELENLRKRTEREKSELVFNANARLIRELLPVLDDFERSLKISGNRIQLADFLKGVEYIHQKLLETLQAYGLAPMKSDGERFDVEKHDALLLQEKKGVESDMVIETYEKGYTLHDRVLRHAKVIVSK